MCTCKKMREIVARLILADLLLIPYKQTTLICDSAADTMPNNPTLGGHATTYLHWIGFVYFYCFLVHTFENFRAVLILKFLYGRNVHFKDLFLRIQSQYTGSCVAF